MRKGNYNLKKKLNLLKEFAKNKAKMLCYKVALYFNIDTGFKHCLKYLAFSYRFIF